MNTELLKQYWTQAQVGSLLDIGANVGEYSRYFKKILPLANILMIEGNRDCLPYLEATALPFYNVMLSDLAKDVTLYKNKKNPICTGTSYYREQTEHYQDVDTEVVKTKTLDALVEGPYDFIKIDTQGSEMDIFNGGQRVMHAARFIQLELSLIEYNQGAPLMNTMMRYMYAKGFRLSAHVEDHVMNGELIQQDFIFYNSRWQK